MPISDFKQTQALILHQKQEAKVPQQSSIYAAFSCGRRL